MNSVYADGLQALARLAARRGRLPSFKRWASGESRPGARVAARALLRRAPRALLQPAAAGTSGARSTSRRSSALLPLLLMPTCPRRSQHAWSSISPNPNEFWAPYPVPSVALDEAPFRRDSRVNGSRRIWRGPCSLNTNWLLSLGLRTTRRGRSRRRACSAQPRTRRTGRLQRVLRSARRNAGRRAPLRLGHPRGTDLSPAAAERRYRPVSRRSAGLHRQARRRRRCVPQTRPRRMAGQAPAAGHPPACEAHWLHMGSLERLLGEVSSEPSISRVADDTAAPVPVDPLFGVAVASRPETAPPRSSARSSARPREPSAGSCTPTGPSICSSTSSTLAGRLPPQQTGRRSYD